MKKIAIIIPIFFFSVFLIAQSDIIYPSKSEKDIKRCKITKVNNNVVYYLKGSKTDSIEAIAILRDDVFSNLKSKNKILLYKNQDYSYYLEQYNRALIDRKIGIGATAVGLAMFATGIITFDYENKHSGFDGNPITVLIGIGAIVNTSIGVVIWSRAVKQTRKSKKAMQMTELKTNLSFGPTSNGVGLVLKF